MEIAREQVRAGGTVNAAAVAPGVPAQTLTYWLSTRSVSTALVRVRVRVEVQAPEEDAATTGVSVTLPCGSVVSGLTAAQAVYVVRRLR